MMNRALLFAAFILVGLYSNVLQAKDNSIQKLYKMLNPAVVELHVQSLADPKVGQVSYKGEKANSLGSGALVNKEGRILTAAHVVDKATAIEVIFAQSNYSNPEFRAGKEEI